MPYTIGITGGIGGGKSTVAGFLADRGASVIDTDAIARDLTAPGSEALEEIRRLFGDEVIRIDGSLDRKAVARIVFNDKSKLEALNAILHPRIREAWLEEVRNTDAPYVFVLVPLLYENDLAEYFDEVWLVTADEQERIRRVTTRDNVTRDAVIARMKNQMPEKEKADVADLVIDTTGSLDSTRAATAKALRDLKRRLGLG